MSMNAPTNRQSGYVMVQALVIAFGVIALTVLGINYIDPSFPGTLFAATKGP